MMTKRTKAILALSGVFVIGAICGALALGVFLRGEVRSAHRLRDRGGFSEYFAEQLELTRAQRDSLQGELDWFYGQFAGLRTAAEGEFHDLIDSLDRRLVAHLSPEQIDRLRRTEQKLRKQLAARRPKPLTEAAPPPEPVLQADIDSNSATPEKKPLAATQSGRTRAATSRSVEVDSLRRADSAQPDPGPALNTFGRRLREHLGLSDDQAGSIRTIVASTRHQIRRDVRELSGFPRLQLEVAAKHLRRMDRDILEVLDAKQRIAYEPIRDDIAARIRAQLIHHMKRGPKSKRGKVGSPDPERRPDDR